MSTCLSLKCLTWWLVTAALAAGGLACSSSLQAQAVKRETPAARCARISNEVFKRMMDSLTIERIAAIRQSPLYVKSAEGDSAVYRRSVEARGGWDSDAAVTGGRDSAAARASYKRVSGNAITPTLRPSDKAWSDEHCWAGKPRER